MLRPVAEEDAAQLLPPPVMVGSTKSTASFAGASETPLRRRKEPNRSVSLSVLSSTATKLRRRRSSSSVSGTSGGSRSVAENNAERNPLDSKRGIRRTVSLPSLAPMKRALAKIKSGAALNSTSFVPPPAMRGREMPAPAMASLKQLALKQTSQRNASGIVAAKRMMQRLSLMNPHDKDGIAALAKASACTNTNEVGTCALPKPHSGPVIFIPRALPELDEICSPVHLRERPYRRLPGQGGKSKSGGLKTSKASGKSKGKGTGKIPAIPCFGPGAYGSMNVEETSEESLYRYASMGDMEVSNF